MTDKIKCKGGWTICEDCRRCDKTAGQFYKPIVKWKGTLARISCVGYLKRFSF